MKISGEKKYLIFSLNKERYAIDLLNVKEIIGPIQITPVPRVPSFYKGIINLRGEIISIVDLKDKLSSGQSKYESNENKKHSIIIVDLSDALLGVIVDDVEAVTGMGADEIEMNTDAQNANKHVKGIARPQKGSLILILDMLEMFNSEHINLLKYQNGQLHV